MNHQAAYDVMHLVSAIGRAFDGVHTGEIHAASYLSCTLSALSGVPPSQWGYAFVNTGTESPFAVALAEAIDQLSRSGVIQPYDAPGRLCMTSSGLARFKVIESLSRHSWRQKYHTAVWYAVMQVTPVQMERIISADPSIERAKRLGQIRPLLDKGTVRQFRKLLEQVQAMSGVLTIPTSASGLIWLDVLSSGPIADEEGPV